MRKYIIHRLLQMIPTIFLVMFIAFALMKLIPGDPAAVMLGPQARAQDIMKLDKELGLDQPVMMQFLIYVKRAFSGDFGRSIIYGEPVFTLLLQRFPLTALLSVMALSIAIIVAVPSGILAALKQNSFVDYLITVFSLVGVSTPIFWFGLMLMMVFSLYLHILPSVGMGNGTLLDTFRHLILPSISLALLSMGTIARVTRSSMLEVLRQDYVKTAYAKGLKKKTIIYRHMLKNAMVPIITVSGLQLGNLLAGAVLTETIFGLPGMGRLMYDAILRRDFLVVQGGILFVAFIYIALNFSVDLLYAAFNPHITSSYKGVAK